MVLAVPVNVELVTVVVPVEVVFPLKVLLPAIDWSVVVRTKPEPSIVTVPLPLRPKPLVKFRVVALLDAPPSCWTLREPVAPVAPVAPFVPLVPLLPVAPVAPVAPFVPFVPLDRKSTRLNSSH